MGTQERLSGELSELLRKLVVQTPQQARRRRRKLVKLVKVATALLAATIVIPIVAITAGLLLGPRGVEGLIATPLAVIAAWTLILYVAFRPGSAPPVSAASDPSALPVRTEVWLEQQRRRVPLSAQKRLDSIGLKLEGLATQLRGVDPQAAGACEARRLLGEELPALVRGYQKVPETLRREPLHGGPSPERRLIEGLATIDEEISRLHERLAADDLHALATQQRYLELKYRRDKLD